MRHSPSLIALLSFFVTSQALAADVTKAMPDRQIRPGVALSVFGAAGDGAVFGDGSAAGDTYQWSFAANADVAVTDDGDLSGVVVNDRNIAEVVSFSLLNGATRAIVEATLTVTGPGGAASDSVLIDVVDPTDPISDGALENLAIEVNIAIDDGLYAMYLTQEYPSGRIGHSAGINAPYDCATTAFSLWGFANNGHGPLTDSVYAPAARRAVQFILNGNSRFDPAIQANIGDPDRNANGWVNNLCPGWPEGYATPIAASALMAAYAPSPAYPNAHHTLLTGGGYTDTEIFTIVEDAIEWTAFAQVEGGAPWRGGWRYTANFGSSDTSVDSWHYLAMEGFEHVFGGTIIDAVKTEAEHRLVASQLADGSFLYDSGSLSGDSSARTAGGLSGILMVSAGGRATPILGDAAERRTRAIAALGNSWNNAGDTWVGNIPNYYAMWTSARALRLAGVDTLVNGGVTFDWETGETFAGGDGNGTPNGVAPRAGYFPYLVGTQAPSGHWPATVNGGNWTQNLNTAWGVLILTPTVFGPPDPCASDDTPPEVVVGSAYNEIWPPNHKCQAFDLIEDCGVAVSDECAEEPADIAVVITGISSDEPFEVGAGGDGHHADDIELLSSTTFELRAERQGGGNSRFYTVTFEATDAAGNTTEGSCAFVVPHDQSPKHARVDDGPAVTCELFGDCVCLDPPVAQSRAKGR